MPEQQNSTKINGRWNAIIKTPIGNRDVIFDISTLPDGAILGTATDQSESFAFIAPDLVGSRLTWSQRVTKPLRLTLEFDVTIDGDVMEGTAKAGKLPSSRVTAVRS